jgi:hypothetical protein
MIAAVGYGFYGAFYGGVMAIATGEPFYGILAITGIAGWCVPMLVEFLDEPISRWENKK